MMNKDGNSWLKIWEIKRFQTDVLNNDRIDFSDASFYDDQE